MSTNVWPLQRDCDAFYGNPRGANGDYSPKWAAANLVHVPCPWALHIEHRTAPFITIHKLCADSLKRVLAEVWNASGKSQSKINEWHYDVYDGSFAWRPKRNGTTLSMHGYGCAIDWDAADNPFRSHKHLFTDTSPLVIAFRREGWVWGGEWSSDVDSMHVQASRVHS